MGMLLRDSLYDETSPCQVLVKHGALVAMSNKYGDTPLSKARPRLKKKLEGIDIQYMCMCRHFNLV